MTARSASLIGTVLRIPRRVATAALLFVALLTIGTATASAAEPRRVLLLHAFGHPYSPWSDEAGSFRAELTRRSPEPIDLIEVSIDMDRVREAPDETPFVNYIRALLAGRKLDLVVPVSAPATYFVQRHRTTLFPATPMLIVGADPRRIPAANLTRLDTAVLDEEDIPDYVENILRLRPDTTEVAIVLGSSPLERFWAAEAQRELQPFTARVHFSYFNDLSFGEMLKRAATMPPHSAIMWGLLSEDAAGVPYSQDRALTLMREVANAPMFGGGDYELGRGIVGGPLTRTQIIGQDAARVAVRILQGEAPGDIKPILVPHGAPMYDWRELHRWNIREALLPPGSIVLFREHSVWQQYRWQILSAITLMLLEAALILALLYEHRRRRNAEIEAQSRLSELAHMNRRSAIGELSASITHELQQPLTAILSNTETAELLLSRTANAVDMKDILADIKRDDLRASEVIKRVRRLLAKGPLEAQEVNLNEVVSEVFDILSAQASARRVTLSTNLSLRPLRVSGDRIQLQQVVLNLVMNAMDAVGNSVERRIIGRTALVHGAFAQVSIEDSGTGIPTGQTEQIFEPFFTTKEGGMGMGLSITRTIVENHGGRIVAENHRGGGAVFHFTVPLLQPSAGVGEKTAAQGKPVPSTGGP
jgi:signal transduction histidine kinase